MVYPFHFPVCTEIAINHIVASITYYSYNFSYMWFICVNYCFTGILHPSDQEKILRKHHVELLRLLNFDLLLPYLNQHDLLTRDEHEDLVNPLHTSATRINKLLIWLPCKGSKFLYRFVECLQQSAEECPPHKELRDLLQRTIRSTIHRQGSRGQYNCTTTLLTILHYFSALFLCVYWT